MKTKLLFVLFLIPCLGSSQIINNFNSTDGSMYNVVTSNASFDPGVAPNNGVWNFTLTSLTTSTDEYSTPSADDVSTYPGSTTLQTTTTAAGGVVETFIKDNSGVLSLTGIEFSELNLALNYVTDNALLGTFPFSSTTVSSDDIAGEAFIEGVATTINFTGTAETYIDNTGTLVMSIDGEETYNSAVTRLSLVQNISMTTSVSIFSVEVATVTQTSYFYYDNTTNDLVFRSTNTVINQLLPEEETTEITVMESIASSSTLGITDYSLTKSSLIIHPNPVKQSLRFKVDANVQEISIFNVIGKEVLKIKTSNKELPVNQLNPGIYIAKINTDKGTMVKKFIKE